MLDKVKMSIQACCIHPHTQEHRKIGKNVAYTFTNKTHKKIILLLHTHTHNTPSHKIPHTITYTYTYYTHPKTTTTYIYNIEKAVHHHHICTYGEDTTHYTYLLGPTTLETQGR